MELHSTDRRHPLHNTHLLVHHHGVGRELVGWNSTPPTGAIHYTTNTHLLVHHHGVGRELVGWNSTPPTGAIGLEFEKK
jgi:hypothetical protein